VVALWLLPGTQRLTGVRFDVLGSLTLGAGATLLLAAVSQGRAWGWAGARTIGCIAAAVALLVWFVQVERRAVAPLMTLSWFRTRNIAFPVLSQMLTNFAYMGAFFLIPQVLEAPRGLGLSTTTVSHLVIARPLAFSLVAPLAAMVTIRLGERVAGVCGAVAVTSSMLLWATVGIDASYPFIIAATALSGIGLGIAFPALTSLMANSVREEDMGVAGAMQQLMTQLGAVLGSAVLATVAVSADRGHFAPFHTAFLVGAGAALAGCVAASFVHSSPRPTA
jgi:MFS family permease